MDERPPRSPLAGMRLPQVETVASVVDCSATSRFVLRGGVDDVRGLLAGLSLPLPERINTAGGTAERATLQLGPDEWLLLLANSAEGQSIGGGAEQTSGPVSIVDVSHRNAGLIVAGPLLEDVLAAGCPLPLSLAAFPVARATRTVFAKIEVVLWRQSAQAMRIECGASLASYLVEMLTVVIGQEQALRARR